MNLKPEKIALLGLVIWCLLYSLAPVRNTFPIVWSSLAYIGLCYVSFLLGCFIVSHRRVHGEQRRLTQPQFGRLFWINAATGSFGLALRLWDKYLLRGVDLSQGSLQNRDILADSSASTVSLLGAVLYPFCLIPIFLVMMHWRQLRISPVKLLIAVILLVIPIADALALFSRSLMIVFATMIYFGLSISVFGGRAVPRKIFLPAVVVLTLLIVTSIFVFRLRLDEMGIDRHFSIANSAYAYILQPNSDALALFEIPGIGDLLLGIVPLMQYYLHGVFEFGLLWDYSNFVPMHAYGAAQFFPYVKALEILGIASVPPTNTLFPRIGVFTSFFGPLWVDFGWFGPFFMIAFGALAKILGRAAESKSVAATPLYAYLTTVILLMPVGNFISSAQGVYIMNAFLVFGLITRLYVGLKPKRNEQSYLRYGSIKT